MYVKYCECCGKKFMSKSIIKKHCSKKCQREMAQMKLNENSQPCWLCKNSCGGCNWSKYFKPVNGWIAEPTIVRDSTGDFSSYDIKECPEFIRG